MLDDKEMEKDREKAGANSRDLLSLLLLESNAYKSFEDIERLVESGAELSAIPLQPLYFSLLSHSPGEVSHILPRLSPEQRMALLDIDIWEKDMLNWDAYSFWLEAYSACEALDVKFEFVRSEEFALYLKGKFHLALVDPEDPVFPNHEHFLVTDDNAVIIEYDKDFPYVQELQHLIRSLYYELGTEKAFAHLYKITADSFSVMEEEEYQLKKGRLKDYGLVDYYDSLEVFSVLRSYKTLHKFIEERKPLTPETDLLAQSQALHAYTLTAYHQELDDMQAELKKVQDIKRKEYLQFNFIRLVNASLSFKNAFKEGSLALTQVGRGTKLHLKLGFDYVRNFVSHSSKQQEGLFTRFDFIDFHRIGHSLIHLTQEKIKKALRGTVFVDQNHEYFLGPYFEMYIDSSFMDPVIYLRRDQQEKKSVMDYETWEKWDRDGTLLSEILPYATRFYEGFSKLQEEGKVQDSFYLNYALSEINFESLIISSFIHFVLNNKKIPLNKMGLTLSEFNLFMDEYFHAQDHKTYMSEKLKPFIDSFVQEFGFGEVTGFGQYFEYALKDQLEGYDLVGLTEEEYKHVGGPIILR